MYSDLFKIIRTENKKLSEDSGKSKVRTIEEYVGPVSNWSSVETVFKALIAIEKEICKKDVSYVFERITENELFLENFNLSINGKEKIIVRKIADYAEKYIDALYSTKELPDDIKENLFKMSYADGNIIKMGVFAESILDSLKNVKKNKR